MNKDEISIERLLDPSKIMENCAYLESLLKQGKTLQELFGFTNEFVKNQYKVASQLYQQKEYEKAKLAFSYLAMVNPSVKEFWMSLAAAQAHLENHSEAITSFCMAISLDSEDPSPYYFTAYSYIKLKQYEEAIKSLKLASALANNHPRYGYLQEKVESLLNQLEKRT